MTAETSTERVTDWEAIERSDASGAGETEGAFSFHSLNNPGITSIPLGFLACYLGTVLSDERGNDRSFHELYVRSETGLGAEK